MEKTESDYLTPVRSGRKSLGIRRSLIKNQRNQTPYSTSSDIKKQNVNSVTEELHQCESPKTPITGLKSLGIKNTSLLKSTSYKLSLKKTLTENHRKKKLSFSPLELGTPNSTISEKECCFLNSSSPIPIQDLPQSPCQADRLDGSINFQSENINNTQLVNYNLMTNEELKNEIIKKSKILEGITKHDIKVNELKTLIEKWRVGFRTSFTDLSNKMNSQNKEELLKRLNLPKELIKYA